MEDKLYIAIDNGTTGSIGAVKRSYSRFVLTPTKKEQSYTKAKNIITRIDIEELSKLITSFMSESNSTSDSTLVVLERPLINPTRFKASISASRALESTLCVLENMCLPYMYVDSKEWQRKELPKGTIGEGSAELKKASKDIASRLYPMHSTLINKHKDGDAILMARWAERENL